MPRLEISETGRGSISNKQSDIQTVVSVRFQIFRTGLCRDTSEGKTLGLMKEVSNNRFN